MVTLMLSATGDVEYFILSDLIGVEPPGHLIDPPEGL